MSSKKAPVIETYDAFLFVFWVGSSAEGRAGSVQYRRLAIYHKNTLEVGPAVRKCPTSRLVLMNAKPLFRLITAEGELSVS